MAIQAVDNAILGGESEPIIITHRHARTSKEEIIEGTWIVTVHYNNKSFDMTFTNPPSMDRNELPGIDIVLGACLAVMAEWAANNAEDTATINIVNAMHALFEPDDTLTLLYAYAVKEGELHRQAFPIEQSELDQRNITRAM